MTKILHYEFTIYEKLGFLYHWGWRVHMGRWTRHLMIMNLGGFKLGGVTLGRWSLYVGSPKRVKKRRRKKQVKSMRCWSNWTNIMTINLNLIILCSYLEKWHKITNIFANSMEMHFKSHVHWLVKQKIII